MRSCSPHGYSRNVSLPDDYINRAFYLVFLNKTPLMKRGVKAGAVTPLYLRELSRCDVMDSKQSF